VLGRKKTRKFLDQHYKGERTSQPSVLCRLTSTEMIHSYTWAFHI